MTEEQETIGQEPELSGARAPVEPVGIYRYPCGCVGIPIGQECLAPKGLYCDHSGEPMWAGPRRYSRHDNADVQQRVLVLDHCMLEQPEHRFEIGDLYWAKGSRPETWTGQALVATMYKLKIMAKEAADFRRVRALLLGPSLHR